MSSPMSSYSSQNYKYSLPIYFSAGDSKLSSYFLLVIQLTLMEQRPSSSSIQSLMQSLAISSSPGVHLIWNDWFHFSYCREVQMGVVSQSCSPDWILMNPPFLICYFSTASTAYVFRLRFLVKFLSLICLSLGSGFLLVCSVSSTFTVPFFFLSLVTYSSISPAPSFVPMSTVVTPINSLPLASYSHDSRNILSLSEVPMLNSYFHMGVLPWFSATLVLQLLSAYLITMKGSILPSLPRSRSSSQLACITLIFMAGFLVFFSIFFSEQSIAPTLFLLSMTSTVSLGMSGLVVSNFSTAWPIIFSLMQTSMMTSGYLLRSMIRSQLQRCLSEGMKQVLTVFQNLPTLILKVGDSAKLPDFRHSRQNQFFFISYNIYCLALQTPVLLTMKKKSDFIEQMKNSEQFLSKLTSFKKASKQIKDKNKLISHRNIWVKEFKYLSRLQRDIDIEEVNYFELFDKYFGVEIEDRQIFGREEFKSYSEYVQKNSHQLEMYEFNLWQQLKTASTLLNRIQQGGPKAKVNVDEKQIQQYLRSIDRKLQEEKKILDAEIEKVQKSQLTASKVMDGFNVEDNDEQYAFLQQILAQHNYDDVKGFDFEHNQIRRIEESQKHLKQYIESLSDRLCEDEISAVIGEYQHASNLLSQTLQLQIQKIELDYEQALSLDQGLLSMSENFQMINHIYSTYLGRGKSVALYNERLGIEYPKVNKKLLDRITEYIEAKIYRGRKTAACKRNYLRQKQELLQKVEREVNERIEAKIKKAQKEAERLQRKEEKVKLEKELEVLRQQYNARKVEKEKVIKQQQQKQRQQERKREAVRKLYLDELSKKAAEVNQLKEKKTKQEEELRRRQQMQEQQRKRQQIMRNKPKVVQRQKIQQTKIEKKLREERQRQEQPLKNQQRINKAIQKYSFRPEVQASQQRLNAPTQGLLKRKQTTYDKADKIELTKMTGYNINQLMGDRRFKLNTALFEAGLANTTYAHEILSKMSKRTESML